MKKFMRFGTMFLIVAMLCVVSVSGFAAEITGETVGHKITITGATIDRSNADVWSVDVSYAIEGDTTGKQITMLGYIFDGEVNGDAANAAAPVAGQIRAIDQTAAAATGTVSFKLAYGNGEDYTISGNEMMVVKFGTDVDGVTSAQAFYLDLTVATYEVAYEVGEYGVAIESDKVMEEAADRNIILPDCEVKAEYQNSVKFAGWVINGVDYAAGDTYEVNGSVLAEAQWEDLYAIEFAAGDGSGEMAAMTGYAIGDEVVLPANAFTAPSDDMVFDSWMIGENAYNAGATYTVAEADVAGGVITATATWKAKPATFTVTYDANGGTGEIAPVTDLADGATVTLAACTFTAPENKEFDGWLVNGEKKKAGDTITIAGNDVTVIAQWKEKAAGVLGDANGNGKVQGTDAIAVQKHVLFKDPLARPDLADVNGNGKIQGTDAIAIQKFVLFKTPFK